MPPELQDHLTGIHKADAGYFSMYLLDERLALCCQFGCLSHKEGLRLILLKMFMIPITFLPPVFKGLWISPYGMWDNFPIGIMPAASTYVGVIDHHMEIETFGTQPENRIALRRRRNSDAWWL